MLIFPKGGEAVEYLVMLYLIVYITTVCILIIKRK